MHQIIFVATPEGVESLEADESPAHHFPCMVTGPFHRDSRTQLYGMLTNRFVDEAHDLEIKCHSFSYDGPYIYQYDALLLEAIARIEEDQVPEVASYWQECSELESLDLGAADIHEFLFQLIHFCQLAHNDSLNLYIYSDD